MSSSRDDIVVVISGIPVVESFMCVQCGKQIRDTDAPGTFIFLNAVAAGGTGNQIQPFENTADLMHSFHLPFIERFEIFHGADVILHLLHTAHSGKHHRHAGEAGGKTDGVAGVAASVQVTQYLICVRRKVYQTAALDRFHDDYGLAMLLTYLIDLPAFYRRISV